MDLALNKTPHKELLVIGLLLILFLGINLWTATRFPVPWYDEVQFVDPAANLFFNNRFTTTAYNWERRTDLHSHHPLYSLLLASWFEMTGFSLSRARAFNYFLIICTVLTLWLAVLRTGLVPSMLYRIFLVLLILFGYSISFPYRSGRTDPLLMFLSALLFLIFTIKNRRVRIAFLSAPTLFFAPAGLHLVVFAGTFTLLFLIYRGRRVLAEVAVIWLASLLGVIGLLSYYALSGVWDNAVAAIVPHTSTGGIGTFLTGAGLNHINRIPKDPSVLVLLGLLGFLVSFQMRGGGFEYTSVLSFGLATSIIIPLALLMLAKFPTYYSWMVFGPLAVCICSALSTMNTGRLLTFGMRAGLVLACITGLPLQLLAVSYDWPDRDYEAVHQVVSAHVRKDDKVLCDYPAYFAAKSNAAEVFLPDYVRLMSEDEKSKVTLLIGSDDALKRWRYTLGGQWSLAAQAITPGRESILERLTGQNMDVGLLGKKYRFKIYRRQTDISSFPKHF